MTSLFPASLFPWAGERRLLAGRSIEADTDDRVGSAVRLSKSCSAIVVHKGAGTVVTDGGRAYVNQTGNSGMATGGAGDVLTGVIAALLGQNMTPFDAAVLGVYLHGLSGDMAAEELGRISITAMHLVEYLSDAFCEFDVIVRIQIDIDLDDPSVGGGQVLVSHALRGNEHSQNDHDD